MAVPFAISIPAVALAQDKGANEYSGHPAVGVWIEPGVILSYNVFHSDGTVTYYNPLLAGAFGAGEPNLPVHGFGVWEPRDDRTADSSLQIAWGDASVTLRMTLNGRHTVDQAGERMTGKWKITMTNVSGEVVQDASGASSLTRMRLVPFDQSASPEGTPDA